MNPRFQPQCLMAQAVGCVLVLCRTNRLNSLSINIRFT